MSGTRTTLVALLLAVTAGLLGSGCSTEPDTVPFFNGRFEIKRPWLWWNIDDLNAEADVQMGNALMEAYLIVLTEPKTDFPAGYALAQFSADTSAALVASLRGLEAAEPQPMRIHDRPALRRDLRGRFDDVSVRYWHVAVDTGEHYHQLVVWSLANRFAMNEGYFEDAVQSLRQR